MTIWLIAAALVALVALGIVGPLVASSVQSEREYRDWQRARARGPAVP